LVRERFTRITFVDSHALRRRVVPALEKIFILTRARPESDEESTRVQNAAGRLPNQVVTLL
jgi:hypothetical protein